jgi:hypothetical protein
MIYLKGYEFERFTKISTRDKSCHNYLKQKLYGIDSAKYDAGHGKLSPVCLVC